MRKMLRITKQHIIKPVYYTTRMVVVAHIELWGRTFWQEWEIMRTDKKLIWLFFVNQTITLLTLIEFLILKKR